MSRRDGRDLPWPSAWGPPRDERWFASSQDARWQLVLWTVGCLLFLTVVTARLGVVTVGGWVGTLVSGPTPWLLLAGVALLVVGTLTRPDTESEQRERLVEVADGERTQWALFFEITTVSTWSRALLAAGLILVVVPGATAFAGVPRAGLLAALGVVLWLGARALRQWARQRGTDGHPRGVALSDSGLTWWEHGDGAFTVGWDAVTDIEALAWDPDSGAGPLVGIVVEPTHAAQDRRATSTPREQRRRESERALGVAAAIPMDGLVVFPPRLLWACVAFRDPDRRRALLDGADLVEQLPGHEHR